MARDRSEIARAAADRLEHAFGVDACPDAGAGADSGAGRDPMRALIGFDGFIDSIIRVVDTRRSMAPDDFEAIETIPAFADRIASAANKSANVELAVRERRFGGNGPLMAGAIGRLGGRVIYVGAVGREDDHGAIDPVYAPFAARCERVVPISPPATTDALEFDDGKIMLGKPANVQLPTWGVILKRVGLDAIRAMVEQSALVGTVNWVMMGGVEGIWRGLIDDVLVHLERDASRRRVFVDLCDPAKRTDEDVRRALSIIRQLDERCPVTLGLNHSESQRIARVVGARAYDDAGSAGGAGGSTMGEGVCASAVSIREALGIECVVVHPRQGAAAADASGGAAWFDGPFTRSPKLSTGAGDHFNGGFALAQALGLGLDECLAAGCGVSGAYVRDAESPTLGRLCSFLRDLPEPEARAR